MAIPLRPPQRYPLHRNYRKIPYHLQGFEGPPRAPPSQRHLQRRTSQFRPLKRQRGLLQGKLRNKGMLAAAGALPIMAGLGALIGGLVKKKKKKTQEGSGAWRVSAHQPFLLKLVGGDGVTWRREINRLRLSNHRNRTLFETVQETHRKNLSNL